MVSSDFGKLEVQRHFSSGIDCAMAGMAPPVAAVATPVNPAALRNSRRFMVSSRRISVGAMTPATVAFCYHERRKSGNLLLDVKGAPFAPCHVAKAGIHWRRRRACPGDRAL